MAIAYHATDNRRLIGKTHHPRIHLRPRNPRHFHPVPQQECVAHDFGLLFQPVSLQRLAGFQAVVVTPGSQSAQHDIECAVPLRLPDMRHLMQEMTLAVQ